MEKINLSDKFSQFEDYWSPKIIGELNGQYIKLAKAKGDFVWHSHENEDEYFQVIEGELIIHFKEKSVTLRKGECIIVPKGVEHKPEAKEEVQVLLFEPKLTTHTGDVESDLTVEVEDQKRI